MEGMGGSAMGFEAPMHQHCHGGIMSVLPTSHNLNPLSPPTQWTINPPIHT